MKPYQIATAAVIMLIAAVAMFDSREDWLPQDVAGVPGGLDAGFYPFWSAALIFIGGAIVIQRELAKPRDAARPFASREDVMTVLRVIVPTIVAVLLIPWLGFYFVTALFIAFFMWYVGHYAIWWDVPTGIVLAALFFFIFERIFLVALPKSFLYTAGILPF